MATAMAPTATFHWRRARATRPWLAAVSDLAEWARDGGARGLVVALGVDAAAGDPESPLRVTAEGYARAGRELGRLGLPTVLVQEGGYDLEAIGSLVAETLLGFEAEHEPGRPEGRRG